MDFARSKGGSLFQTGLMLWFSGSSVHMWSLMMTGMALTNPLKELMSMKQTFKRFDDGKADLLMPMLMFVGVQLICMFMGLYKLNSMGLLPTTSADWLSYLPSRIYEEQSAFDI